MNFWGNDGGQDGVRRDAVREISHRAGRIWATARLKAASFFRWRSNLPHGWAMGAMTEFDFAEDADGRLSPGVRQYDHLRSRDHWQSRGYVEFFSLVSTERNSDWIGTFDMGLTYALNDNLQLDCGVNIGVTRSADDLNPFRRNFLALLICNAKPTSARRPFRPGIPNCPWRFTT